MRSGSSARTARDTPGVFAPRTAARCNATPIPWNRRPGGRAWASPAQLPGSPMDIDTTLHDDGGGGTLDDDDDAVWLEECRGATPGTMSKRLVGPVLRDAIREMGEGTRGGVGAMAVPVGVLVHFRI